MKAPSRIPRDFSQDSAGNILIRRGRSRSPASRRKSEKDTTSGYLHLYALFIWLRVADAFVLRCVYPRFPLSYQSNFLIFWVAMQVWITGLLLIIAFRQRWAKYVLVTTIGIVTIGTFATVPGVQDAFYPFQKFLFASIVAVVFVPAALLLIFSRHIHRLTSSNIDWDDSL